MKRRDVSPLKVEILTRGLVQGDVAKEAGISEHRLSRILHKRTEPREAELLALANVLGIERKELAV